MHRLSYSESQHIVGGVFLIALVILVLLYVIFRMKRSHPSARILSILVLTIGSIIVVLLATIRLETRYYTDTVEYQFGSLYMAPFEVMNMDSVSAVSIGRYDPSEYGGWGVKGNVDTRVYNASGDNGVLFTFKSGKKLLLGAKHPDSLKAKLTGHYPIFDRSIQP